MTCHKGSDRLGRVTTPYYHDGHIMSVMVMAPSARFCLIRPAFPPEGCLDYSDQADSNRVECNIRGS